jgi:uncharacterized protein
VVTLGLSATAYIALHAVTAARRQLEPHHVPVPAAPAGHEAITFRTDDGLALRGWWHQGARPAVVVLVHGHQQTRADLLPEATVLAGKGFSTLLFDLRAHGESEGEHSTLGDKERLDVAAAIATAAGRAGPVPLGLLGFSIGATAGADVAWKDERVKAVLLAGMDADVREAIEYDFRRWGALSQWPALQVAKSRGIDLGAGHLREAIPALAQRGLFVIIGSQEPNLPEMRELVALGKASGAETWEVEGSGHGRYAQTAPEEYPRRMVEFFERKLLPKQ